MSFDIVIVLVTLKLGSLLRGKNDLKSQIILEFKK